MRDRSILMKVVVVLVLFTSCCRGPVSTSTAPLTRAETDAVSLGPEDHAQTVAALRPPKRKRPVVAVLGDNAGTETTDFLIPYGVLRESDLADVIAVAPDSGPIQLMPALRIRPQQTIANFDAMYPEGADYVIVPAMHHTDSPPVLDWIRAQSETGALIVGVCSGALVLAQAGLLEDRAATTHWFDLDALERKNPTMRRVDDRRYVVDRDVVTTTGVTASVPISLALIEAIGGKSEAAQLARKIGADADYTARHQSAAFRLDFATAGRAALNWLLFWRHERVGIRIESEFDEIALAFTADAYSRTYRSRAITVARSEEGLISKRGLVLLPDEAGDSAHIDRYIPLESAPTPVEALDETLDDIAAHYGNEVASFVALQLEYTRRSR